MWAEEGAGEAARLEASLARLRALLRDPRLQDEVGALGRLTQLVDVHRAVLGGTPPDAALVAELLELRARRGWPALGPVIVRWALRHDGPLIPSPGWIDRLAS